MVTGNSVHREAYSYYLIIDGYEVWGYDRDPSHEPAEHKHIGADHVRHPAGRVSFKAIVAEAWETLSHEEVLSEHPSD